jgi:hypothetical protein
MKVPSKRYQTASKRTGKHSNFASNLEVESFKIHQHQQLWNFMQPNILFLE